MIAPIHRGGVKEGQLLQWLVLLSIAAYLLLNVGFMLLRFPPIGIGMPMGELLIVIVAVLTFGKLNRWFEFTSVAPMWPLVFWWLHGMTAMLWGVWQYGSWAFRDASSVIEASYLWIGFYVAASPGFWRRWQRWISFTFTSGIIYSITYVFRDVLQPLSPKVQSASGYEAPIFFSYVSTPIVALTGALRILLSRRRRLLSYSVGGLMIVYVVVLFQARTIYLEVLALIILVLFARRGNTSLLIGGAAVASGVLSLLIIAGMPVPGRLQSGSSVEFLLDHIMSIVGVEGGSDVSASAAGVQLRLDWWTDIWDRLTASPERFLLGLGYGFPLIDFSGPAGDVVREPHSSFVSTLGRLGVVGLFSFVLLQTALWRTLVSVILHDRRYQKSSDEQMLLTLSAFCGFTVIFATSQPGLELPYIAIPYYFFFGVILRYRFECKEGRRTLRTL